MVIAQLCAISPRIVDSTYSCSSPEMFGGSFYLDNAGGGCASPPGLAPLAPPAGRAPGAGGGAPAWSTSCPAPQASDIPVLRRLGHGSSGSSGGGGGGGNSLKTAAGGTGGGPLSMTAGDSPTPSPATGASSYASAASLATPRNGNSMGHERQRRHHRRQVSHFMAKCQNLCVDIDCSAGNGR